MSIMSTTVYWAKLYPDAKIPEKDPENAGFDVYPCFEESFIRILPHETKSIPTGIASMCTPNYCFILKERGSTGIKGIAQRCGVIDSGYRGEWFVPITNTASRPLVIIKEGERGDGFSDNPIICPYEKAICQALLVPVPNVEVETLDYQALLGFQSNRGIGCLGSSGK